MSATFPAACQKAIATLRVRQRRTGGGDSRTPRAPFTPYLVVTGSDGTRGRMQDYMDRIERRLVREREESAGFFLFQFFSSFPGDRIFFLYFSVTTLLNPRVHRLRLFPFRTQAQDGGAIGRELRSRRRAKSECCTRTSTVVHRPDERPQRQHGTTSQAAGVGHVRRGGHRPATPVPRPNGEVDGRRRRRWRRYRHHRRSRHVVTQGGHSRTPTLGRRRGDGPSPTSSSTLVVFRHRIHARGGQACRRPPRGDSRWADVHLSLIHI